MSETVVNIEAIREATRQFVKQPGKTQARLAKAAGVSSAMISQFLQGKYEGNVEKLAYSLQQIMAVDSRREQVVKKPNFVMTNTANDVFAVIKYAHEHSDMGTLYGPAGIGKTVAIEQYVAQNPSAIYICADATMARTKPLLEEICDRIGADTHTTVPKLKRNILAELKGSGRLLIIDEAQHLAYDALESIRQVIHDACGIGVIFCGNEMIYSNLVGRKKAPFAQLFSRIGIRRRLSGNVSMADIRRIFCQDITLADECLAYLHEISNSPGGIRLAVKLFTLAWEVANKTQEMVSLDIMISSYDFIMHSETESA